MTPEEFCFWLKGIALSNMPVGDMGAMVLRQAGVVLDHVALKVKPAAPQAMRQTKLIAPLFCVHNVSIHEVCRGCVLTVDRLCLTHGVRIFAVPLPPGIGVVYINDQDAGIYQKPVQQGGERAGDEARCANEELLQADLRAQALGLEPRNG